jgi:glycosyltransferase involved in cell wall biosynthesis
MTSTSRPRRRTRPSRLAPTGVDRLDRVLTEAAPEDRTFLDQRIATFLSALSPTEDLSDTPALLTRLERTLASAGPEEMWLAHAVITGHLPEAPAVQRLMHALTLDGPVGAVEAMVSLCPWFHAPNQPSVEVVTDRVLVDVHHTSGVPFATGIQRVAREASRRWRRDHAPLFMGWSPDFSSLRRLSADEIEGALNLTSWVPAEAIDATQPDEPPRAQVLVPWKCMLVVAELPVEPGRTSRYQSMLRFSRSGSGLIGHDCVPLTAAETSVEGMAAGFASFLNAMAYVDRIATVSDSSATEYRGWREMLRASGRSGPRIRAVPNATEAREATDGALVEATKRLCVGSLPMVLVVGSHEPRKNHLAVLHAAETLWREGIAFTLVLIGGNSWNSAPFYQQIETLRLANRPIEVGVALSDDLLWAAYRLAYFTVFPSLHEGFGLPVGESLASGTPVITSSYGSMSEIARHGGALLVDPRDDQALTVAMRQLLTEPRLRDRLRREAGNYRSRSWDEYAEETWAYLVDGV